MSTLEVNSIAPLSSSSDVTLGGSSKNIKFASGTTVDFSTNSPTLTLGADMKNTPSFRVGRSSAQTISNATHAVILFDSEQFDTDNAYDTSNGRFTVPSGKAGKYFFYGHFRFQSASIFDTAIEIHKNGSQIVHIEFGANGNYPSCQASYIGDLAEGDYIQLTAYQASGSNKDLTGIINYTAFGGFRLT